MVQKRSRLELIYDILDVIRSKGKGGVIKPTPLLRFANLSTQRFEKYVKELGIFDEAEEKKNEAEVIKNQSDK